MPDHHHSDSEQTCANPAPATIHFPVPENLLEVLHLLQSHSYRVVIVGGALRDFLLGDNNSNNDYDLASDALPQTIQKLFPRCLPTGIQHGTVRVMRGKDGYEITTFRRDGAYKDGRRPEHVSFTGNLSTDLERRDFSINAIAFEPDPITIAPFYKEKQDKTSPKPSPKRNTLHKIPGRLHDLHNGQKDLKQGHIRAIGVACIRFEEDALRMLRACRFSAKLGFHIETQTLKAIQELHTNLSKVSKPRIQNELSKLLNAPHAALGLHYLSESGLWPEILSLPIPENWHGIDASFRLEQYTLLQSLQEPSLQAPCLRAPRMQLQPESFLGELLHYLKSSNTHTFLRWDNQKVPQVSFAWALLHLSFSWAPEPSPNKPTEPKAMWQNLQTTLQCCLQTALQAAPKTTSSQNKKTNNTEWPLWHYALHGLEALPFSKRERNAASYLLRWKNLIWGNDFLSAYSQAKQAEQAEPLLRHWLALYGTEFSLPALCLLALSLEAQNTEKTLWSNMIQDIVLVLEQNPALRLQDLAINGKILAQECAIPAGPHMAKILQRLLAIVLWEPQHNHFDILAQRAKDMYQDFLSSKDAARKA